MDHVAAITLPLTGDVSWAICGGSEATFLTGVAIATCFLIVTQRMKASTS